jgi:hypothetical protein
MEKVINLPGITDTDLKVVQQCHLYLKATTISDLINSTGTALADWVVKPDHYPNNAPPSYLQYSNQGKPTSLTSNKRTQPEPPTPWSDPLAAGTGTNYTNHGTTCTAPPLTQSTVSPKIQHQQFTSTTDKTITANASDTLDAMSLSHFP